MTLGVGAFALKFLWPAILPAVGGLLKGALAKFALFAIGGIGKLINAMIVGSGLTGIALGIGPLFERFGQGTEDTFVDADGNFWYGDTQDSVTYMMPDL